MKKEQIEIGGTYETKVGGRRTEVRIDRAYPRGGWEATSLSNNKKIRLKASQSLRALPKAEAGDETGAGDEAQDMKETTAATGKAADPDIIPLTALDKENKAPRKAKEKITKTPAAPKAAKNPKALSCLDAAAQVLAAKGEPMACKQMIEAMAEKGLWKSDAPTPAATLYSAILREITKKAAAARFKKTDRGHFALSA
jgi:HB1, ASXL, restriction endonuclease HTH domain